MITHRFDFTHKTNILYYGSPPIVYRSAGYYKFITSQGKHPFVEILKKHFDIEVVSWTKRINYMMSMKRVYLIDFLAIIFHIIKKSTNKDIFIILGFPTLLEFTVLLIISKLRQVPIIVRETHWYWPSTKVSRFLWYIYVNLLKYVDGMICPGKAPYKYWKALGFTNVHIVHFYALEATMNKCEEVKLEYVRKKYKIPENSVIVLYLGRLIGKKGVDIIIKAFAKLIKENKKINAYLVIAGDGPEKHALIKLSKQLGIHSRVVFTGPITEGEKECIYRLADIFVYTPVLTEIPEEWPIAPLEAMGLGIPTIVSNIVGSLPDIGSGVKIIKQRDVNDLKRVLNEIITNKVLRKELSIRAIKVYRKIVNENIVYKEFLEALIRILKEHIKQRKR